MKNHNKAPSVDLYRRSLHHAPLDSNTPIKLLTYVHAFETRAALAADHSASSSFDPLPRHADMSQRHSPAL
jgi:hypothetical protein